MLAPHHGKDAKFGVARRAAEDFPRRGRILSGVEVVLRDEFGRYDRLSHSRKIFSNKGGGRMRGFLAPNKQISDTCRGETLS